MENTKEFLPYLDLLTVLVSSILALALAYSAKNLIGRGWLIASATLALISRPAAQTVSLIAQHSDDPRQVYHWFDVIGLLPLFGTACFGMFLFSIWSSSRMKIEMRGLLFSFTGRIPRSAFWIMTCILFPLGMLGFAPLTTEAEGFVKGLIWAVYAAWLVPGVWISIAIAAKRWHDCGKSGWMTLVVLIPVIGSLWFLGYCGFVRGTAGQNQFGDNILNPETA